MKRGIEPIDIVRLMEKNQLSKVKQDIQELLRQKLFVRLQDAKTTYRFFDGK